MVSARTWFAVGVIIAIYATSLTYYVDYYDAQQAASSSVEVYVSIVAGGGPGGTASYSPDSFTVVQGVRVTLVVSNGDRVTHGIAIPAFRVDSGAIQPGDTARVTFTPRQSGSFTFDEPPGGCAAGGGACDSASPMTGVVTVVPPPQ